MPNDYTGKSIYSKHICELMRRINLLQTEVKLFKTGVEYYSYYNYVATQNGLVITATTDKVLINEIDFTDVVDIDVTKVKLRLKQIGEITISGGWNMWPLFAPVVYVSNAGLIYVIWKITEDAYNWDYSGDKMFSWRIHYYIKEYNPDYTFSKDIDIILPTGYHNYEIDDMMKWPHSFNGVYFVFCPEKYDGPPTGHNMVTHVCVFDINGNLISDTKVDTISYLGTPDICSFALGDGGYLCQKGVLSPPFVSSLGCYHLGSASSFCDLDMGNVVYLGEDLFLVEQVFYYYLYRINFSTEEVTKIACFNPTYLDILDKQWHMSCYDITHKYGLISGFVFGCTPWLAYTETNTESLGVPDAGDGYLYPKTATIPVNNALCNAFDNSGSSFCASIIFNMRAAIVFLSQNGYFINPNTGNPYTWGISADSLYYCAMGDRTKYGATGGAKYTWTNTYLAPNDMYDIDIGELYECVRTLEESTRNTGA